MLMETTAPHLTRPLPMLLPLTPAVSGAAGRAGPGGLRRRRPAAPGRAAPAARRSRARGGSRPPRRSRWRRACGRAGCAAGCSSWDGQLEDDARLVTTIARTAAGLGAEVRTRARVVAADRPRRHPRRRPHRRDHGGGRPRRSSTPPACGPTGWSRGSRCDPAAAPTWCCAAPRCPGCGPRSPTPVPGSTSRFVMVLPQPDGAVHVGLTDEPVDGPVPDVPEPTEPEIGFLLDVVSAAFDHDVRRSDVVGAHAGLRPLLDDTAGGTADLSRRHAVLTSRERGGDRGRRQADHLPPDGRGRRRPRGRRAAARRRPAAAPGRSRWPAPPPGRSWRRLEQPRRLVRRYGTDAALVLDVARSVTGWADEALLAPVAPGCPVTHGRAGLRRHPRGCRRRLRPARPAYPGRPRGRRPRRRRTRRGARARPGGGVAGAVVQ